MEHPKTTLARYGLTAKKSLGQNFIFDDHILGRITDAAELNSGSQVLEVGPGLGSLTHHLAHRAGRVVAVELDNRLLPLLRQELGAYHHLELVHADILDLDPADYFRGPYKAVGNVPYYITGAILRHLLSAQLRPELMVFTVQQEVAERIASEPGGMSLLAVTVQLYAQVELAFKIKAGAFWPKPAVDSAVLRMTTHRIPLLPRQQELDFMRLVKVGFSQRRKQLQKNLRVLGLPRDQLAQAFERSGVAGQRRAQSLSIDEWLDLYNALL